MSSLRVEFDDHSVNGFDTGPEAAVGRALVAARQAADETLAEARLEADRIRAAAKVDAEQIRTEARADADGIRGLARAEVAQLNVQIAGLRNHVEALEAQLTRPVIETRPDDRPKVTAPEVEAPTPAQPTAETPPAAPPGAQARRPLRWASIPIDALVPIMVIAVALLVALALMG